MRFGIAKVVTFLINKFFSHFFSNKNPLTISNEGVKNLAATYSPTDAVPSALTGLTTLFGMGRGGSLSLKPPESFAIEN